jgi:hypothetical protein
MVVSKVGTVFNARCINMSPIFFRLTVDNRRVTAKPRTIAERGMDKEPRLMVEALLTSISG